MWCSGKSWRRDLCQTHFIFDLMRKVGVFKPFRKSKDNNTRTRVRRRKVLAWLQGRWTGLEAGVTRPTKDVYAAYELVDKLGKYVGYQWRGKSRDGLARWLYKWDRRITNGK
jgi:hypothetical protein